MLTRFNTPRLRFAAAFVYACVAVAASVSLLIDAVVPRLRDALKSGGGDCVINWLGARAWRQHVDVFSPAGLKWAGLSTFGHPPTTPLWYLPFTRFDIYDLTQSLGHLLIIMLLVHLVVVAAELRAPVPLATALLAYALVMDAQWWVYHVTMLQLSEPIALLYVLAWVCLRRDHDVACGILLGLACSMKVYAGLVVVVLLLGRRWSGVVAAILVYLAFVVVASSGFGWVSWREYLPMMRETQAHWMPNPHNASIHGIVLRWWQGHHGSPGGAAVLSLLASVAIVAAMAWGSRRAVRPKPAGPHGRAGIDDRVDLPFALFSTASVWLNSVVWEHYDATLLLPLAIALFSAWRQRGRFRAAWIASATVLFAFVVYLLSINMYEKNHAATPALTQWYITANWLPWPLTLGLCGALLWRRERTADVAPPAAAC